MLKIDSPLDSLAETFRDWQVLAGGTRGKLGLYHAQINPDARYEMTQDQWKRTVEVLEKELGFDGQPINGKAGADILWGGANDDVFAFDLDGLGSIDTIKDFSTAQGDKLDIADLLTGYDPLTSAITDFLEITTSGSDSVVKIDRDGTGGTYSLTQIATIESVTGLTDEAALLTAGNVIAA